MKLLDIVTAPWLIEPSKLLEIQGIYAAHLRGEKIDIAGIEAKLGRPLANEAKPYEVVDGVALISVDGVLAKRMNMMMQISGGTSMQMIERDIAAAVADPSAHSIVLMIDSPGGTVDGTQTLASAVRRASASKPIVALASGTMASAAYWVGSAADAVYIDSATTSVGSIGVVAKHVDMSRAEESQGLKTTEITAGKYKRVASQYAPLSEEGRASIQEQVDYIYGEFVDAVAAHRGVSVEKVLSDMADGRVFMGKQAVQAGLVDGVMPLDDLLASLNSARSSGQRISRAGVAHAAVVPPPKGTTMLTIEQLKAEHPQLAQALREEGAVAERERIQGIESALLPGHEKTIAAMKFDGKSTAGDAALAIVQAESTARASRAQALLNESPEPVKASVAAEPKADAPKNKEEMDRDAKAYMAKHPGTDYVAAYKAVGGV